MSILTSPRKSVQAKSRPLNVSLLLTIRETDYSVTPIDPGPDNVKAYRLEKLSGDRETYDLAHTNDGLVVCDCPSYVASHEGTISTCKHGSALVLMGLLPKPCCIANARAAYDDAREKAATVAPSPDSWEAKAAAIEAEAVKEIVPDSIQPPARVIPPFDPDFYRSQNAVVEGRALWLAHRHLFTSEPLPEPAPCCDPAEVQPCAGCIPVPAPAELPITRLPEDPDATDDDADHVLNVGPAGPDRRTLAEQVDVEARHYRTLGTDFGDLIAEKLEKLAAEIRFLDAKTPASYRDRRDAAIDSACRSAEARMAAAGVL